MSRSGERERREYKMGVSVIEYVKEGGSVKEVTLKGRKIRE